MHERRMFKRIGLVTWLFTFGYVNPNPNQVKGGTNGPSGFENLISLEPKVGLTSNQAAN